LEGDCAVEVGEEDAFGLVFEGLWERHDGGVEEVVLQQCRAICLLSIKGAMGMRNVVQNEFGVAALRGFVEAHIQKNLLVGEGSCEFGARLFLCRKAEEKHICSKCCSCSSFPRGDADLVQLVEFDQYEGSRPSFPTVVAVCHSVEVHQP